MEAHASGFSLKSLVRQVEHIKGDEGVRQLEDLYGPLNFLATQSYEFKDQERFHTAVCTVLFGEDTPDTQRKLGAVAFKAYTEGAMGRAFMAMLGRDIRKALFRMPGMLNKMMKKAGVVMEMRENEEGDVQCIINDCCQRPEYLAGFFDEVVTQLGGVPSVTWEIPSEHNYIFSIRWE